MLPIFIASVIAVAIIIDRYIVIRKSKLNAPAFLVKIRSLSNTSYLNYKS